MNKNDFMQGLRMALAPLPWEEYQSAMKYYEEYFEDAGENREQDIIAELGSPEAVAASILKDYAATSAAAADGAPAAGSGQGPAWNQGSGTAGYTDAAYQATGGTTPDYSSGNATAPGFGGLPTWAVVALVVLLLPIWLPLAGGLLSVLFGLLAVIIALLFAAAVAGVAFLLGGFICVIVGCTRLFFNPAGGLITIGGGLVLLGLSIPLAMAAVWLFTKAMPAMVRGMVAIVRRIFNRK